MKQTNLLKGLLAILALLCSTHSWAYDFEVDNIQYTIISFDDMTVEVSGLSDRSVTKVVIPETVEYRSRTLTVISIVSKAFYECSSVASVDIPESVTSIGTYAFYKCSSLTSVNIPEYITSIGEYTFYGCTSLTNVDIPESLTTIGIYAFYKCSSLNSVNIPENITSIGEYTFYECSSLKQLSIPENVTSIGNYAFYDCSGLTELIIPENVTSIGSCAFYSCSGLTELTIPENVTSMGSYVFAYCTEVTQVNFNAAICKSGGSYWYPFRSCSKLMTVKFGDSVTIIPNYLCYDCTNLREVTIPESVTEIGSYAFFGCSSLRELDIPNSVTELGHKAFVGCSSLETLQIGMGLSYVEEYVETLYDIYYKLYCCYPLLWTDGPSQMNTIRLKDGTSEFSVRGYGYYRTSGTPKGEPLFSNIDVRYYYIGRPLTDINEWTYRYVDYWTGGSSWTPVYAYVTRKMTVSQPYGTIHTLEIGGCCYDVPYFYQSVEYLILDENVDSYTSTKIYQGNLKGIMCKSPMPPIVSGMFDNSTYLNVVLYVPTGSKATYEATEGWKDFWEIVEMDVNDMTPEYTAVEDIVVGEQANVIGYYTIDSKKVSQPQRGINIIRYSDGSTRKVLVK